MLQIRKTLLVRDIVSSEMGHIVDHPTIRAAALAVTGNPFAGRYVEDLTELFEAGRTIGEQLMPDLVRLLQRSPVSYGKGAVVGINGLQLDEREPVGPRMPTVRRTDRAGRRWSPLRPFSAEERAPGGRPSRISPPLRSAERLLN